MNWHEIVKYSPQAARRKRPPGLKSEGLVGWWLWSAAEQLLTDTAFLSGDIAKGGGCNQAFLTELKRRKKGSTAIFFEPV